MLWLQHDRRDTQVLTIQHCLVDPFLNNFSVQIAGLTLEFMRSRNILSVEVRCLGWNFGQLIGCFIKVGFIAFPFLSFDELLELQFIFQDELFAHRAICEETGHVLTAQLNLLSRSHCQ